MHHARSHYFFEVDSLLRMERNKKVEHGLLFRQRRLEHIQDAHVQVCMDMHVLQGPLQLRVEDVENM